MLKSFHFGQHNVMKSIQFNLKIIITRNKLKSIEKVIFTNSNDTKKGFCLISNEVWVHFQLLSK
jgi:hypothetical protein